MVGDFVKELTWRNFIQDLSDDGLVSKLNNQDSFYLGIDPTAPSLQLGNLVPMIAMTHIAQAGLKPILLLGGATGAIGDPTGKSKERVLIDREKLDANVARQKQQIENIFKKRGLEVEFVNNYDWTHKLNTIEFLRDIGKHFTVNYMIAKETVKARLNGDGISYTEFSYMLLQALDFKYLFENNSCKMQIGGSDQWGNMTAGIELVRKSLGQEVFALSVPLATDSSGKKFGKSEDGAIWLDPEMTSPYKLYQFLVNTKDEDVIKFLKFITFLNQEEINALETEVKEKPENRSAQKVLAQNVVELIHGQDALTEAEKATEIFFGGDPTEVSEALLVEIFSEVPSVSIPREKVSNMEATEILAESGACASKGEAKRLVKNGGAYINNKKVEDLDEVPVKKYGLEDKNLIILRTGKKNYRLVKVS